MTADLIALAESKLENSTVAAKDLDHLATVLEKTNGEAWEPPSPRYPWIMRMIEGGYLARCDMRCGFEAFKDSGLRFTDAGLRAVSAHLEGASRHG